MNLWLEEESCYLILNWRAELREMNKGKEGARDQGKDQTYREGEIQDNCR